MWPLSLPLISITLFHLSLGGVLTTSSSLDNSDSIPTRQHIDRGMDGRDDLAGELISLTRSEGVSVDGSGHMVDGTQNTKELIQRTQLFPSTGDAEVGVLQIPSSFRSPVPMSGKVIGGKTIPEDHGSAGKGDSMESKIILPPSRPDDSGLMDDHVVNDRDLSGSGGPCVLGSNQCAVLTNSNGTKLLWDDMKRTLAFAWEIHVFGSASLFILVAGMAVLGMAGGAALQRPLCDALTLGNSLLVLSGSVRAILLLLDPYGTRQILSRPALAALHNLPLHLLMWAQGSLALVALRGVKLILLPGRLQRPWCVAVLAVLHCTPLLAADLLSSSLSPALPLLLQTLSLCWGLPFCVEILTQSLSHLQRSFRTKLPQWVAPQRIENHARRLTVICGLLGVLCCSLQLYSVLWLYGLLGNWRHFGWGWWLVQFWARVLELAWGFFLLVLGSWIFWTPQKSRSKSDLGQGRLDGPQALEGASFWDRVLVSIGTGPFKKSEKHLENLMPNNWTRHNIYRTGVTNNAMCNYDDQTFTSITDHMPWSVNNSNCDSQAAVLWGRVSENECVLSLIEFDMKPPSPINLRRSIDNAFHHGQITMGSLFAPSPPPGTNVVDTDVIHGEDASMTPIGYRWTSDTGYATASTDHCQDKELPNDSTQQMPCKSTHFEYQREGQNTENKAGISESMHQDWSEEDIIDL